MKLNDSPASKILETIAAQGKPATPAPAAVVAPVVETPPVAPAPVITEVVPSQAPTAVIPPVAPMETPNNGIIEDWEKEPTLVPPSFDFAEIGKAIGLDGIKTKEDLTSRLQVAPKPQEAPQANPLDGVPDQLKRAIDIAKQGGDYLQHLKISQVDYSKIAPEKVYESWVAQQFTGPDGKVDEAKYQDALAQTTPIEKELFGRQKINEQIAWQRNEEDRLSRDLEAKKQVANIKLREALDKVSDVKGFKMKASHKNEIYESITSGKMQQELFFDKEGSYDYEKMASNYFKVKNFDKIVDYLNNRTVNQTKREILNEVQNVVVTPTTEKPVADPKTVDAVTAYIQELQGRRK